MLQFMVSVSVKSKPVKSLDTLPHSKEWEDWYCMFGISVYQYLCNKPIFDNMERASSGWKMLHIGTQYEDYIQ